jgi:hypothetical protein
MTPSRLLYPGPGATSTLDPYDSIALSESGSNELDPYSTVGVSDDQSDGLDSLSTTIVTRND